MLSKFLKFFKSSTTGKPSLGELATSMGLERRRHYRALYPQHHSPYVLPQIRYEDFSVKAKDISEGGFCICSNRLTDQLTVGEKYEFELYWCEGEVKEAVEATMIGVSFEKIHFQFSTIQDSAAEKLAADITIASRGMRLTPSFLTLNTGIETDYKELWANPFGDQLIFKKTNQPWIKGVWFGSSFELSLQNNSIVWPERWTAADKGKFLVFLCNVPAPSADLKILISALMQSEQKKESA